LLHKRLALRTTRAVVHHSLEIGCKPLHLSLPVAHQRSRTHHQRRRKGCAGFPGCKDQGNSLDGLAQPHIIRQAGT